MMQLRGDDNRLISSEADDELVRHAPPDSWTPEIRGNFDALRAIRPHRRAAVVVAMRNDGISILQWVAHYRALGFDGIFVYSNDDTDGSAEMLELLARHRIITYIENRCSASSSPQIKAFEHSIHRMPELRDFEWVYYADSDELLDLNDRTVGDFLTDVCERFPEKPPSAICFRWRWFTSDFRYQRTPELLLERFQYSHPHQLFKSIVRLADVISMRRLHFPDLIQPNFFVNADLIKIDESTSGPEEMWQFAATAPSCRGGYIRHYWNKSFEEFAIRKARGDALRLEDNMYSRDFSTFFEWNRRNDAAEHTPASPWLLDGVKRELKTLLSLPGVAARQELLDMTFKELLNSIADSIELRKVYDRHMSTQPAGMHCPDLAGEHYQNVLQRLHEVLKPTTYLEIGVAQGDSLALAQCASIGIDPDFEFRSVDTVRSLMRKPALHLFRSTSEAFFARHNPDVIFGGPVDLAFLDGMHQCEYLLRDFVNVEKYCRRNSLIVLHDCIPVDIDTTTREPNPSGIMNPNHTDWWLGDVWRTALLLKRRRKDLAITVVDAFPSGLVCITRLDRSAQMDIDACIVEMMTWSLDDIGIEALHRELDVKSSDVIAAPAQIVALLATSSAP